MITQVSGMGMNPPAVAPVERGGEAGDVRAGGRFGSGGRPYFPPQRTKDTTREEQAADATDLSKLASRAGLEVHLLPVEGADTVVMRFVDPTSGEVVHEFPSEHLVEALAELRRRARARIDEQA